MRIAGMRILIALAALGILMAAKTAKADENGREVALKAKGGEVIISSGNGEYIDPVRKDVPDGLPERKMSYLPKGKFYINASAYTASADECGKSDGITASGKKVKENETIACPREFPFGTKLHIDGFGTYICQDRGGAIRGDRVDIYMETKDQAFAFGRQRLIAEIVE